MGVATKGLSFALKLRNPFATALWVFGGSLRPDGEEVGAKSHEAQQSTTAFSIPSKVFGITTHANHENHDDICFVGWGTFELDLFVRTRLPAARNPRY